MTNIVAFLLARIAEDEAEFAVSQRERDYTWLSADDDWTRDLKLRLLAECAAKRKIVAVYQQSDDEQNDGAYRAAKAALRALANVYADHPDFDPTWA